MSAPLPPFAPARAAFPCPGVAAAAARAPLGGPREGLTALVMLVRLAGGMLGRDALAAEVRQERAAQAKAWAGALALGTKLRGAVQRAIAASAGRDRLAMAEALVQVTDVTAPHLDRVAGSELDALVSELRRKGGMLAAPASRVVE